MNRALFAGLSGTVNNQTRLDVVGNNLANASTVGFKASRSTFRDAYYQTLRGGQAASGDAGGVNPVQVGSGSGLGTIQTMHTQGAVESTGQPLDCAIEGPGMFVLRSGDVNLYSRDGSFTLDDANTLVSSHSGLQVQGWMSGSDGINTTVAPTDMQFDLGSLTSGEASQSIDMQGNLNSEATGGADVETSIQVYDSLGDAHEFEITMTKAGANSYDVTLECEGSTATGTLSFDGSGAITAGSPVTLDFTPGGGAAGPQSVAVDFSNVTQLAHASDATAARQDGRPPASLVEVAVQGNGIVQGTY
ncbi:MAG: flagellar hook-basal body complex protein, partial [Armatimonadota bacterium]